MEKKPTAKYFSEVLNHARSFYPKPQRNNIGLYIYQEIKIDSLKNQCPTIIKT